MSQTIQIWVSWRHLYFWFSTGAAFSLTIIFFDNTLSMFKSER